MEIDSDRNEPVVCNTLEELIQQLHVAFSEDHVNVDYVKYLMSTYKSNPAEWRKFAKADPHRYTRNLVDKGNGKFNLMLLCWNEAQGSAIHDHANSHCFVKILAGELHEEMYDWPEEGEGVSDDQGMKIRDTSSFQRDQVAYINDTIGLHRVENRSHTEPAVSLHLYVPPFNECCSFDQRSGRKRHCKVTFYSEFGKRTPFAALTKRHAVNVLAAPVGLPSAGSSSQPEAMEAEDN